MCSVLPWSGGRRSGRLPRTITRRPFRPSVERRPPISALLGGGAHTCAVGGSRCGSAAWASAERANGGGNHADGLALGPYRVRAWPEETLRSGRRSISCGVDVRVATPWPLSSQRLWPLRVADSFYRGPKNPPGVPRSVGTSSCIASECCALESGGWGGAALRPRMTTTSVFRSSPSRALLMRPCGLRGVVDITRTLPAR